LQEHVDFHFRPRYRFYSIHNNKLMSCPGILGAATVEGQGTWSPFVDVGDPRVIGNAPSGTPPQVFLQSAENKQAIRKRTREHKAKGLSAGKSTKTGG
jgi:hypothetical protein